MPVSAAMAALICVVAVHTVPQLSEDTAFRSVREVSEFRHTRAAYQFARVPPEQTRRAEQQQHDAYQQSIGYLEAPPEYHPELGSLFASIVSLGGYFCLFGLGMHFWDGGRRGRARPWLGGPVMVLGIISGLQSILGLVFGFDWWSLLH